MKKLFPYLVALVCGVTGVFAFSPFHLWYLAYPSLMGLIWVAKNPQRKTALWASFLWGLGFFSFGVNWIHVSIHDFGGAPLWLSYLLVGVLAAYLSLFVVLFAYVVQRFDVQSPAIFPAIWTLTEFLRGWLFTGFPWLQFGYSQIDSPFAGLAPLFGEQGLTFFAMWVAAMLYTLIRLALQKPKRPIAFAFYAVLLVVLLGLSYASARLHFVKEDKDRALRFTLLQGNIEQQMKWDPAFFWHSLDTYRDLIDENLGKTDVIILPESALPLDEHQLYPFLEDMAEKARASHTEIVIGTVRLEKDGHYQNSIIDLGNPQFPYSLQDKNRYVKHHLVPFGEYVPFEKWLRSLGTIFNLPMSSFESGARLQANLHIQQHLFAPAICYEILFGEQLRENMRKNTDYILTISNDAWFGNSIGPWQHLQIAQMRALELGRPLIRATNTGITVFVNAQGKIVKQAPQFITTSLSDTVVPTTGRTPYAILGSKPLYFLIILLIFFHSVTALAKKALFKHYAQQRAEMDATR